MTANDSEGERPQETTQRIEGASESSDALDELRVSLENYGMYAEGVSIEVLPRVNWDGEEWFPVVELRGHFRGGTYIIQLPGESSAELGDLLERNWSEAMSMAYLENKETDESGCVHD